MEHDGIIDLLNQCRQDQLRLNLSGGLEYDYQTFGQRDNVETYIGLLDFKKRFQ